MGTHEDSPRVTTGAGSRARVRERPPRCGRPKSEDGHPCRRTAGRDTDHFGEGPCSLHDDGTWTRVPFAENVPAREAFLEAVEEKPLLGVRALCEPLGYHRRDVQALIDSDREYRSRYEAARGWDLDTIRREVHRRAFDGSDRLLEFEAKMRLPEAEKLRQTRLDGQVDVTVQHVLNIEPLLSDGIRPELQACTSEVELLKALLQITRPRPEEIRRDQRPALELVAGSEAS